MTFNTVKATAIGIVLLMPLANCAMPGWNRIIAVCIATDDPEKPQCFSDFDEAVRFQRSKFSDTTNQIKPLKEPIAQSAVIVWPTLEEFEQALKGREYRSNQDFRNAITIQEDRFLFIESLIRQRNIFLETNLIRGSSAEAFQVPADSFVVWLKLEDVFEMRAPREVDFIPLGQNVSGGTGYLDAAKTYLGVIEKFVLDHRLTN